MEQAPPSGRMVPCRGLNWSEISQLPGIALTRGFLWVVPIPLDFQESHEMNHRVILKLSLWDPHALNADSIFTHFFFVKKKKQS